jgi:hypothetical protein
VRFPDLSSRLAGTVDIVAPTPRFSSYSQPHSVICNGEDPYASAVGIEHLGRAAPRGAGFSAVNTSANGGFRAAVPFAEQVTQYLQPRGYQVDPNAFYLIDVCSNDVKYAIEKRGDGPFPVGSGVQSYIAQAAGALVDGIAGLYNSGARNFIVANIPESGVRDKSISILF